MCSEFLLALIYFLTIFVVNFFLYKVVRTYFSNVSYLFKIKTIFQLFKKSNNNLISLFHLIFKKEKQKSFSLTNLSKFSKTKDRLIIGNTYKYLAKNFQNENNFYYFQLLENQYLLLINKEK